MLVLSIAGCADQSFLTDGVSDFTDTFSKYQNFRDSKEPQTNSNVYELNNKDIKDVEEVPLNILEEYDLSGPQNAGIVRPADTTMVGNEEAGSNESGDLIYVYSVGDPFDTDSGTIKWDYDPDESRCVFVPQNEQTLKNMLGVSNLLTEVNYDIDEFQEFLVSFSAAADNAFKKGTTKPDEGADEATTWCKEIKAGQYLDRYWDISNSYEGDKGKYRVKYDAGGKEYWAYCTGIWGEANDKGYRLPPTLVTLQMLYNFFGKSNESERVYTTRGVKDIVNGESSGKYKIFTDNHGVATKHDEDLGQNFFITSKVGNEKYNEKLVPIPALNSLVLTQYTIHNKALNLFEGHTTASGQQHIFFLDNSYLRDSYVTKVDIAEAKKYKEFAQKICADVGSSANTIYDKDESTMYHSPISAFTAAHTLKAKALVYIGKENNAATQITTSSDRIKEKLTKAFGGVPDVNIGTLADLAWVGKAYGLPVIKVQLKTGIEKDDTEWNEISDKIAGVLKNLDS